VTGDLTIIAQRYSERLQRFDGQSPQRLPDGPRSHGIARLCGHYRLRRPGEPAVGTYEFQDLSAPGPCETEFFPLVAYFSASNGSASRYQSSRGYVRITDVSVGRIRARSWLSSYGRTLVSLVTFSVRPATARLSLERTSFYAASKRLIRAKR
jgi:hypothetical protein